MDLRSLAESFQRKDAMDASQIESAGLLSICDSTYAFIMIPIVIDTNVFVAGLRSAGGASRSVLRRALEGSLLPLFGNALWTEYQDLLDRRVWGEATTADERLQVLAALALQGRWVTVYYGWRPN